MFNAWPGVLKYKENHLNRDKNNLDNLPFIPAEVVTGFRQLMVLVTYHMPEHMVTLIIYV